MGESLLLGVGDGGYVEGREKKGGKRRERREW